MEGKWDADRRILEMDTEGVTADIIFPDFGKPFELYSATQGTKLGVKPLDFERNDIEVEVRHLRLHDEVPMRLIHAALGPMLERGRGRILNVASIAAFMPRSTYGAAKGWIVSFSRWADVVYAPRGVTVTAVCAGFVHTNFHARLGLPPGEEGIPGWLWLDAPTVVSASLRDLARGRSVSIPSLRYKVLARLIPLLPDRLTASIGRRGR
ncbi:MAG: SDR family NAD(P)-dependent oxidoreductase [Microbacterium sp.]|nr:SDR family NAD(P)-dependent oxidoreductase [Microbacterium sp.]